MRGLHTTLQLGEEGLEQTRPDGGSRRPNSQSVAGGLTAGLHREKVTIVYFCINFIV